MNLQIKANRRALDEDVFRVAKTGKKRAPIAMADIVDGLAPAFESASQVNLRAALNRLAAAGLVAKIGKGPSTRYYAASTRKALPSTWGERG